MPAFHPNNMLLALGGYEDTSATVRLWDIKKSRLMTTLSGHASGVLDLAFTTDGRFLVTGSQDGTVRLWGVPSKN